MNREERLNHLCTLYRENRATPEEARELLDYFATRPPEELDKLLRPMQAAFKPDPAWKHPVPIQEILLRGTHKRQQQQISRSKRLYLTLSAAAACLVLLGGMGYFLYRPEPPVVYAHQTQEKAEDITLPDNTLIRMLPHTSLTYTATVQARVVTLTGVAQLNVATDAQRPFTIQTRHVVTQILGTSLFVDASPARPAIIISLASGSIQVKEGQHITRLHPNQQISIPLNGAQTQVKAINAVQLQWLGQTLPLHQLTFEQATRLLSGPFGVTFVFEDAALRNETIETTLEATETLADILDHLTALTGGRYRIEKNKVYLSVNK